MKKEVSKRFRRILLIIFAIVFLISFSWKIGWIYYDVIPWFFLFSMVASIGLNTIGILIYPITLVYQPMLWGKLEFFSPFAFLTFYSLIIIGVLVFVLITRKHKLKKDINLYLLLILGSVALISTLINGFKIGFGNYEITHYAEAILIFLVLTTFIEDKKNLRIFSWIIVFAVAALSFRHFNHVFTYDIAVKGFENNHLARMFSFYVPFLLGLFSAEKDKYLKIMVVVVAAFTIQSVTQLGSRATFLSLGVALLLFGIYNIKKKSVWVFGILAIIFFAFFVSPLLYQDIISIKYAQQGAQSSEGSIKGRFEAMENGWKIFKEKPFLGHGVYQGITNKLNYEKFNTGRSIHNAYVIIAIHIGLLGLIPYILLFIISSIFCFKAMRLTKNKNNYIYNIANGTLFGIIAIAANQFMLNQPYIPTVFIGFGLSSALYYLAKQV